MDLKYNTITKGNMLKRRTINHRHNNKTTENDKRIINLTNIKLEMKQRFRIQNANLISETHVNHETEHGS